MALVCPDASVIIAFNRVILEQYPIKKADRHEVLSHAKINFVVYDVLNNGKEVYQAASILLHGIVCKHAFASGNKRTGFFLTRAFIERNGGVFCIQEAGDETNRKILTGIREGFYSLDEIERWLKDGKIKEFVRG